MEGQGGQPRWWAERGFWGNPYDTRPLGNEPDAGELLVGRGDFLVELKALLLAGTAHPAVAGPYGGGKTSLVRCLLNELWSDAHEADVGQLLLPIRTPISPTEHDRQKFVKRCLLEVSGALVEGAQAIQAAGGQIGRPLEALSDFTGKPLLVSGGGGASVLGSGGTGTRTVAVNTGFGFDLSGLLQLVRLALKEAFPNDEHGAVVGCIDDVELCGESEDVLQFLSDIREPLLNLQGVKWVILGADQVLQGVGDHPRLAGVVRVLQGLPLLPDTVIAGAVERRIRHFHAASDVTVPVNGEAFCRIYERSGRHLRAAFDHALAFSVHADNRGILDSDELVCTEEEETILLEDEEEEKRQWLRWDVPPELVDQFLNRLSLEAWDRLAELGGAAAAVLADLRVAEAVEADVLIRSDPSRDTALKKLASKRFVASTIPGGPPVGIVRLTGNGHLAVDGGRRAGYL